MASAYWRANHTVDTLLQEREVGWEFLQLVKLLLLTHNQGKPTNDDSIANTLENNIRFSASLASDFPPSEIRQIEKDEVQKIAKVILAYGALTTKDGPLPEPFVEWVRELSHGGDSAMAEFLDIFNNRLMALRYLISRSTRPNLVDTKAKGSETGRLFQALSGSIFNRKTSPVDIRLAGLLANNRLSFPVAKQLLEFTLGLPLKKLESCKGGWLRIDDEDQSSLNSASLSNSCQLGSSATIGKKVWDQQKAIELFIGPLSWSTVKLFIPGGKRHKELIHQLARITDCRCDCRVVLLLKSQQVPNLTVSSERGEPLALGLTTVLAENKENIKEDDVTEIRFVVATSDVSSLEGVAA